MGHRSSKSSAGSPNGNSATSQNKSVKTASKHLKRRSTQSEHLITSNDTDSNIVVPNVQFEDGTIVESSDLNDFVNSTNSIQSVAHNQSGQIIIKIQFRRRFSRMEQRQSRMLQQVANGAANFDASNRHLTDANSNQLSSGTSPTVNKNYVPNEQLSCARSATTESTRNGAAGSSRNNTLLNNNIEAINCHVNELHISEPKLDLNGGANDAAEYCEVLEEPSIPISNKKRSSKNMSIASIGDDYTRRSKSKSTFMNLKNMIENSTSKSSKNKESQQSLSNVYNKNNNDHSNDFRTHQFSVLPVSPEHSETTSTVAVNSTLALTSPTPISITTSATASSGTPPTNSAKSLSPNQVSIWGPHSRTDVIIPLNSQVVVVCPHESVLTLGRVNDDSIHLTTEIVGSSSEGENSNLTTLQNKAVQSLLTKSTATGPIVHSQVDFVHCLVPDLERIMNSSFYWGKMDRYEAERLLEGKTEGTFLLRDSAQEEYLFSVTFRKYGRSLHARIEQSGHKFSFDCHDPCVFTAPTVTGLLEHYKDPACVMFFEPMLTIPFHRKTAFSLQELARATIVSHTTYDGINQFELPLRLKAYLKEYHYKQKLRVKPVDDAVFLCT